MSSLKTACGICRSIGCVQGGPCLGFWYEPHCYHHATCRMGRCYLGRQAVGVGLAMGHSRRQAGLEDLRTQRVCVVLQAQRVCEVSHFGLRRQARAPQASGAGGWAGDGALTSTGRSLGRAQRIGEVSHFEPHRQARAFRRQGLAACLTCSVCRRCVRLEAVVRFHILSRADKRVRLGVRGWRRV